MVTLKIVNGDGRVRVPWNDVEENLMVLTITILQLVCGLILTLVVLLQSGKSAGLSGAIGGVADSFLSKNKAKTADAKLAKATKWIGAVFIVLTLTLNVLH
jgi:preprotein translocase subunit SecG